MPCHALGKMGTAEKHWKALLGLRFSFSLARSIRRTSMCPRKQNEKQKIMLENLYTPHEHTPIPIDIYTIEHWLSCALFHLALFAVSHQCQRSKNVRTQVDRISVVWNIRFQFVYLFIFCCFSVKRTSTTASMLKLTKHGIQNNDLKPPNKSNIVVCACASQCSSHNS